MRPRSAKAVAVLAQLAIAATFGSWGPAAAAMRDAAPTVVELFTSQGCDSCPRADRLIGEYATRPEIVALTYNVDYWDYAGWADTFASAANTKRQKAYARAARRPGLHTPQVVIDGQRHVVGSDPDVIEAALREKKAAAPAGAVIQARREHGRMTIRIPESAVGGDATVWLVRFDRARTQQMLEGENAGRRLTYYNVVRDFWSLGLWLGTELTIVLDERQLAQDDTDGCAILVQEHGHGRILGALLMNLASADGSVSAARPTPQAP